MPKLAYHPELAARAKWLPHGVARPWSVPLLRGLGSLSRFQATRGERIALDGCSALVYRPSGVAGPRPGLVWMHGGGLLIGDARQEEAFALRIADELGVVVASAEYRLAPEHPFPTPLHDCLQVFDWLVSQPDVDAHRVMVGGASAGGGLAAALCQLTRERGSAQPSFQLLVYPMLDDRSAEGTDERDPLFRVWDRRANALGWQGYLRGHDRAAPPPHAVPARTRDLSGLPPAWIGVGDLDLFRDEDLEYARRLGGAGVPVSTEVVEGAYHGFDAVDLSAPVSRAFRDAQLAALSAHLRTSSDG